MIKILLEDTSVPVSASTHRAVISLSKRKMHMGMNLQSRFAEYFTAICEMEAKQPRRVGPKSWNIFLPGY